MDTRETKKHFKLIKKYRKMLQDCIDLHDCLTSHRFSVNKSFNGIKADYWYDICENYETEKLMNVNGDVFFVDNIIYECEETVYITRRVLWNLQLSDESYKITKTPIYDIDGEYEYTEYTVAWHKG